MLRHCSVRRFAGTVAVVLSALALPTVGLAAPEAWPAAPSHAASALCAASLSRDIPRRARSAPNGGAVMNKLLKVGGAERDAALVKQVLAGNVPSFLRHLVPVTLDGTRDDGQAVRITICVTPDYLAIGDDRDFVRVPMGLPAAAHLADALGFMLPTTNMVDAIYAQARVRLAPKPMQAGRRMRSTAYLLAHNETLNQQRDRTGEALSVLTAGDKKDIVLSTRLRTHPGRVAIYGWHRLSGRPIQPLSTVHGAAYCDYSHGVRLVSRTAYVNGHAQPLAGIMRDRQLSRIVSREGPIADARRLMASLY